MYVEVGDIEIGTLFTLNGSVYEKSATCCGRDSNHGDKPTVGCYPKLGGKIQRNRKFHQMIPTDTQVSVI